jgi:hypothetical protein
MAVFISAADPLPFVAWDPGAPGFHLQALSEAEAPVRARLRHPHVYFLGAHTGCSCGFNYGLRDVNRPEDRAEDLASEASVRSLRAYLEAAVAAQGEVDVLATWDNDWAREPRQVHVTPAWFGGATFEMPEHTRFRVTRD